MDIKRRSVSAISSKVLLLLEDLQVIIFDRLIRAVREDTLTEFNRLIRKRKFIDDIQIDNEFRVHLLQKQIVEKKDLIKICRRSGIAGIQRSLRKYAFSQLCEMFGTPDEKDFGKELESCHLNEFELMMEIDKDTLSQTVEKPRRRLMRQSSGGCVRGAKSPPRVQSNRILKLFLKVSKSAQRGEKTFSTR